MYHGILGHTIQESLRGNQESYKSWLPRVSICPHLSNPDSSWKCALTSYIFIGINKVERRSKSAMNWSDLTARWWTGWKMVRKSASDIMLSQWDSTRQWFPASLLTWLNTSREMVLSSRIEVKMFGNINVSCPIWLSPSIGYASISLTRIRSRSANLPCIFGSFWWLPESWGSFSWHHL